MRSASANLRSPRARAAPVFIKVFDDLGTPQLLNVNTMLAPQACLWIAGVGINDPMGYVISFILVAYSVFSLSANGIYLHMQSAAGRGSGAALGISPSSSSRWAHIFRSVSANAIAAAAPPARR